MDPITNPYAPGAGAPPPELAGRDEVREAMRIAIGRVRLGRAAKSAMLVGLRGVGKTVLLDRIREDAIGAGAITARIEAPEKRSLPALLAPQLRQGLIALSRVQAAKDLSVRGLRALAGFVRGLRLKFGDIEVGLDYEPEPGLADNGDLEHDLQDLFEVVGEAARAAGTVYVIFIDELQYVEEPELAVLITVMHRMAQRRLPLMLIGAGLPQLRGRVGDAKSYVERLFDFPAIGALPELASIDALVVPAIHEGVSYETAAVRAVLDLSQGYPYFLQEWGKHAWDVAHASPITKSDIDLASVSVIAALDESFFRVRFDRLTPSEKRYLRGMADLGAGPHRSGDIANHLDRKVTSLAPLRNGLIAKGMIWSPNHGDTAFTVPLFDQFMQRIMPGDDWKNP